jgi:hypothetical protein
MATAGSNDEFDVVRTSTAVAPLIHLGAYQMVRFLR